MFKNPFSFEGRIRRLEYGLSNLIYFLCLLIISIVTDLLGGEGSGQGKTRSRTYFKDDGSPDTTVRIFGSNPGEERPEVLFYFANYTILV